MLQSYKLNSTQLTSSLTQGSELQLLKRLQHVLYGGFKFHCVVFLENTGGPIPDYLMCSINNGIPTQGILHK